MRFIDYNTIIRLAWDEYGSKRTILAIEDISAKVSTNHVFKISFRSGHFIIAKISTFGEYEHFRQDHRIINNLAINLLYPFENFIARSLIKNNEIFTYRYQHSGVNAWLIFYNPVRTRKRLPSVLDQKLIKKMGRELAHFHEACAETMSDLPDSVKTMEFDIRNLLNYLDTERGGFEHRNYQDTIREQCQLFLQNANALQHQSLEKIPVFLDWNIGNFSIDHHGHFFSRWDYDWFRVANRVLDFYFWSRVVRSEGDQTIFSYTIDPLNESRFHLFLKSYHEEYPLTEVEIRFIKEAYRFFILNYVIKFGRYFFLDHFALKLKQEAFDIYFDSIDRIDIDAMLKTLKL